MQSYLVTMLDRMTNEECRIVVQSSCPHGMQVFVDRLAAEGKLELVYPVVIDVDDQAARHIPLVEQAEQ